MISRTREHGGFGALDVYLQETGIGKIKWVQRPARDLIDPVGVGIAGDRAAFRRLAPASGREMQADRALGIGQRQMMRRHAPPCQPPQIPVIAGMGLERGQPRRM